MSDAMRLAILAAVVGAISTAASAQSTDFEVALTASGRRSISAAPSLAHVKWEEVGSETIRLRDPRSLCFRNDELVVADASQRHIVAIDLRHRQARLLGRRGAGVGEFASLEHVSCYPGTTAFLVPDLALHRVTLMDSSGRVLATVRTPDVPQIDILGDYALSHDGKWFESWLGSRVPFGPFLSAQEWDTVSLARGYSVGGEARASYGRPREFENTVARRVFNRTFLRATRDELWVLTQGDATIRAFRAEGGRQVTEWLLPVHSAGRKPKISIGRGHPNSPFRPATLEYDPEVGGFDLFGDSLLAVVRYKDWSWTRVGGGSDLRILRRARCFIALYHSRTGILAAAYDAPGMVLALAAHADGTLAIVSEGADGSRRVYIAALPQFRANGPRE